MKNFEKFLFLHHFLTPFSVFMSNSLRNIRNKSFPKNQNFDPLIFGPLNFSISLEKHITDVLRLQVRQSLHDACRLLQLKKQKKLIRKKDVSQP